MKFKYATESPFWYLLAHNTLGVVDQSIETILDSLNERARGLELPIVYKTPHALAWATACQLFITSQLRYDTLGRLGFNIMLGGFDDILSPKGFTRIAFNRIMENIESPSFPGRSRDDSIADSFLANGLKLIDEETVDPSLDHVILATCLSDDIMLSIGRDACQPKTQLWDITVKEYSAKRPGAFRRMFTNPTKWLFD